MRLKLILKRFLVCILLLNLSCDDDKKTTDPFFQITNWSTEIYEDQTFSVTVELHRHVVNNLWLTFENEPWKSQSVTIDINTDSVFTINTMVPSIYSLTSGTKKLRAHVGKGQYGQSGGVFDSEYSKTITFHKTITPPEVEHHIERIVFGSNDPENNGFINDPRNEFLGNTPAVYYRVEFDDSTFRDRTKIRKVWRKDGDSLFKAIQIVESRDNAIWGKLQRNDGLSLENGLYHLQIERFMPNSTYEYLVTDSTVVSIFEIK